MSLAHQFKKSSPEVFTLQSFEIEDHWYWIERLLKRVKNPDWKLSHVREDLNAAKAQAWGLIDDIGHPVGLVVTRIENLHGTRFGLLWIAAGNGVEHSRLFLDPIEAWFKSMGCERAEIAGRRGWEKVLPDYKLSHVVLAKELL